jgi:hypothetical protein
MKRKRLASPVPDQPDDHAPRVIRRSHAIPV